jgi:hypothetical protein
MKRSLAKKSVPAIFYFSLQLERAFLECRFNSVREDGLKTTLFEVLEGRTMDKSVPHGSAL